MRVRSRARAERSALDRTPARCGVVQFGRVERFGLGGWGVVVVEVEIEVVVVEGVEALVEGSERAMGWAGWWGIGVRVRCVEDRRREGFGLLGLAVSAGRGVLVSLVAVSGILVAWWEVGSSTVAFGASVERGGMVSLIVFAVSGILVGRRESVL